MPTITIDIPATIEKRVYVALCGDQEPTKENATEAIKNFVKSIVKDYEVTIANEEAAVVLEDAKEAAEQIKTSAIESVESDIVL
jgi:hypothetical protein